MWLMVVLVDNQRGFRVWRNTDFRNSRSHQYCRRHSLAIGYLAVQAQCLTAAVSHILQSDHDEGAPPQY